MDLFCISCPHILPLSFLESFYQDLSLGVCSRCQQAYSISQSPREGSLEEPGSRGRPPHLNGEEGAQKGHMKDVLTLILKNKFQDRFGVIHGLDWPVKDREVCDILLCFSSHLQHKERRAGLTFVVLCLCPCTPVCLPSTQSAFVAVSVCWDQ